MTIVAMVLAVATATTSDQIAFRLALGTEWDTNARRTITASAAGDGVARLVAELDYRIEPIDGHTIDLGYVLGTKRFFGESTEDLLVHTINGSTDHQLSTLFSASSFASLRASRMRSGLRDYSIAAGGVAATIHPLDF